jgi:hypothetical protein
MVLGIAFEYGLNTVRVVYIYIYIDARPWTPTNVFIFKNS